MSIEKKIYLNVKIECGGWISEKENECSKEYLKNFENDFSNALN